MNLNDTLLRLRALLFRRRAESELEEELTIHLELQIRKYVDADLSVDEATRRARLDFGAQEKAREECRDARRIGWISNMSQDLRYALRMVRRAPGFTGFVVLILALGMGANLATFSVADAIMLRELPVKDPGSLFRTVSINANSYDAGSGCSYPLFLEMQKRVRSLADLMAYQTADLASVSIDESGPERLMQQTVSGNYFELLGVQAEAGRMIQPEDDSAPGEHAVAVLSYRIWRNKFNKSPKAIGSKLQFDGRVFDIVGIAPPEFFGVEVGRMVDLWTPVSMASAATLASDHDFWLRTMGRLRPGVTIARAAAPMQTVMHEAMLEDVRLHAPPGTPKQIIDRFLNGMRIKGVAAGGGISYLRSQYEQPLRIMIFVVGLVMLIACSNVASLLIARGYSRQQELAIRLSLGAGKARVIQQFITESLLLAILSACGGLWVTRWTIPFLVQLLTPSSEPASLVTKVDLRFLAFTSLLMLLTVMFCGLLPAIRFAGADMYTSLKNGPQRAVGGRGRARRILVTGQVALSLVLVIGAGLFTRTLMNLLSSCLGFNPASVLVTRITLQNPGDKTSFFPSWSRFLRAVKTLPGVERASLSSAALFSSGPQLMGVRTTAAKSLPVDPVSGITFVSSDYRLTMGIGFVGGRSLDDHDELEDAPAVAMVNEAFARKFFGDENPLGRKLTKLANSPAWTEIVGIVRDVEVDNLREAAPPMIYIPYGRITDWVPQQGHPGVSMFLEISGRLDPLSLSADLHQIRGIQFETGEVFRQRQLIDDTLVRERLLANISGLFGGLALLLAGLGLYGVMSYAVAQRRQELGIRMALGAEPTAILRLILRDSTAMVALGISVGIVLAVLGSHWIRALLFGLAPNDLGTFLTASLLLLITSLAAAFVPAYRAAKDDPVISLRHE